MCVKSATTKNQATFIELLSHIAKYYSEDQSEDKEDHENVQKVNMDGTKENEIVS